MNVPIEIVAAAFAAILSLQWWMVRKIGDLKTEIALLSYRLGQNESKTDALSKMSPRMAGSPLLGKLHQHTNPFDYGVQG